MLERIKKRVLEVDRMDEQIERAYSSKEVSLTLNVGDSTLRKWAIALEKNGYGFIRNDLNRRAYVEGDLVILRHFQSLVQEHNMQLDSAAKLVISKFGKGAFEVRTDIVLTKDEQEQPPLTRSNDDYITTTLQEHIRTQGEINQKLIERLDQQEKFNRELLNKLDQQQDYLKERFERMERDRKLTASLRESLKETQRQYQLQIAAAQEEKKKGFFARLFGG